MDLTKLTMGDKVIAGSGIALFIFSFFNWLGFKFGPVEGNGNAWDFNLTMLAVVIGIAMVVLVALKAFNVNLPDKLGNFTWGQVLLVLGAVAFALVLIKLIVGPDLDTGGFDVDVDKTRKIGVFLGLIATAGLAAGGYLRMQEDKAGGATPPPPAA